MSSIRIKRKKLDPQDGFTIVELMIALSVLSVILVMSSVIMSQIGALYTKGVNSASLQNTARGIMSDVSQSLQFSSGELVACDSNSDPAEHNGQPKCIFASSTTPAISSYCIDNTRYSYILNREYGDDNGVSPVVTTPHVLWRDTMSSAGLCPPLDLTVAVPNDVLDPLVSGHTKGFDLASNHTRLTKFSLTEPETHTYNIDTWTAFGDSDLENAADAQGHVTCKGGTGTQFCAIAELSSTVTRRIESDN